ncbi:hypothetical protein [Aeromicrobium sp.]|uniref:hypothetical protein n=1 Tax=Aeromicrobium sp. TaxID=1871063 RepID=UPI003C361C66
MRMLAVVLLLVLAGCGGGSDPAPKASPDAASATVKPTVAAPEGTPAPEALSRFRCAKDAKGTWTTSGYVSNPSKSKVTFQVTVYVGEASGAPESAKTRTVPDVAPGGSAKFSITKLPATQADAPCRVQVLAQR